MGENPQEVWQDVQRWERETGYSLETFYSRQAFDEFSDLSDEQKERGVALWERYQAVGGGFGSDV